MSSSLEPTVEPTINPVSEDIYYETEYYYADYYEDECSQATLIRLWILTIILTIINLGPIYCVFKFIRQKMTEKAVQKCTFYSGLLFFICSIITLIAWTVLNHIICYPVHDSVSWIATGFYAIVQLYLLWLVMFIRLYFVFADSVYALSKRTAKFLICIFVGLPFGLFIGYWFLRPAFLLLGYGLISLAFSFAFASKLHGILKWSPTNDKDDAFFKAVVKTGILSLTSFILTALVAVFLFLMDYYIVEVYENAANWRYFEILWNVLMMIDSYSNFVCVLFTYSMFDDEYTKCCGYIDAKCRECLFKSKVSKIKHIELGSHSPTDTNEDSVFV